MDKIYFLFLYLCLLSHGIYLLYPGVTYKFKIVQLLRRIFDTVVKRLVMCKCIWKSISVTCKWLLYGGSFSETRPTVFIYIILSCLLLYLYFLPFPIFLVYVGLSTPKMCFTLINDFDSSFIPILKGPSVWFISPYIIVKILGISGISV